MLELILHTAFVAFFGVAASVHTAGQIVGQDAVDNNAAKVLDLEDAITRVLDRNPSIKEMRARVDALESVPSQLGTLPDPEVFFNALNLPTDTFALDQENMTQMQVGVSQRLPFPGKLALKESVARFEATAGAWGIKELRLSLVRDVSERWWGILYLDQARAIVTHNQDLLRQLVEIARTRYSVGKGLQQDVLLAQLELSKLLDEDLILVGARERASADLRVLLAMPPASVIRLPRPTTTELPDPLKLTQLIADAAMRRPLLAQKSEYINAAGARLNLAKKAYYPDLKLGAAYGFRDNNDQRPGVSRPDFASFKLSMNVPIWSKRRQAKAVDQRRSEVLREQYARDDARAMVTAQIERALADFYRAREQHILFERGIIPQARQTVASMLAGYQVDQVDFLNLVRAQVTLFRYETRAWRALTEARQARVRLQAAVGGGQVTVSGDVDGSDVDGSNDGQDP